MLVEIDVPEHLSKKIKALSVLTGNTERIEELLVSLMDKVVNDAIVGSLQEGLPSGPRYTEVRSAPNKHKAAPTQKFYEDASGIADGLGDEDLEQYLDAPADRDPEALIPQNGLSDRVLDRDMELRDPSTRPRARRGHSLTISHDNPLRTYSRRYPGCQCLPLKWIRESPGGKRM